MADTLEKLYGRVVAMSRQTHGSPLTAAASIAATVLSVASTDDFDAENGGQVVVEGAIYDYVEVDETASTITLDTGLLAAADVDDLVELFDPEVSGVVVEYVADVLLDDQDPGDEPIEVTVQHGLVNLLAESVRGGAAEAVVLVRDGEDDWIIWQIDGKLAVDVALEEVAADLGESLQDAYDRADEAAAAAADAAANATTALTAANGKNKVTYSLSAPGTTVNTAGDIWFQKDSATQTIIGQWQGQGGTSWQQVTLNNQVIANLDAGKLVAGSAFTNALSVKTNFTLGDASTNGVIQSHNFAGSSVGVFIDKFGLVAKGGSVAGATITGGSVTGATVQTAASGQRVVLGSGSTIQFYTGLGGEVLPGGVYALSTGGWLQTRIFSPQTASGAASSIFLNGDDSSTGGILLNPRGSGGLTTNAGDFTATGSVRGQDLFADAVPVVAGGEAAFMTNSGRIVVHTSPSLLAYKRDVSVVEVDTDALAQVRPITWRYREDVPFELSDPDETFWGIPADPLLDSPGLAFLTDTDADGTVSVKGQRLPLALLAGFGDHHPRIAELERTVARQQELIDGLTARIEAIEAK